MSLVEISVDSVESAIAAEQGGAHRIELCSALSEGGITPSLGLLRSTRKATTLPVFVLIRPRGGDFLYTDPEFRVMQDDIAAAAQEGANGVVLGLLTAEAEIDLPRTRSLVEFARPMQVTFHRAFDMARDLERSLELVINSGADRILTSGGKPSAQLGQGRLSGLVRGSAGRITILVGGGVRPSNIADLATQTGAHEFHSALRRFSKSPMQYQASGLHLGGPEMDEYSRCVVHADDVRELVEALGTTV